MAIGLNADPITLSNMETQDYEHGTLYYFQGRFYRFVKFLDAVTYAAGHSLEWASANGSGVTNDRAGGSILGTSPTMCCGICLCAMTQNYYGFMQVAGIGKVDLSAYDVDGSAEIAKGDQLIIDDATDGKAQQMADTEEHLVFAVAIAASVSSVLAAANYYLKGMI